jgi:hypothetical protein
VARSRSLCPEGEKPDSRRPDHHSRDGQRRDPKHPLLGSSRARGTRGETRELAHWTPLDMNGKWLLMDLRKSFCCATRASQKGRFDAFAKPSANVSYLRKAAVAERARGRRSWAGFGRPAIVTCADEHWRDSTVVWDWFETHPPDAIIGESGRLMMGDGRSRWQCA